MFRWHRWHVFLSHAHEDADTARQMAAHFEARGLSCWLDRHQLRAADPFDDRILDAIGRSCVVVALLSRIALSKDYVRHEVSSALGRNSKIAPYFLERIAPDDLRTPFDFKTLRRHSLSHDPANPEESFAALAKDLRAATRWCRWPGRLARAAMVLLLLAGAVFIGRTLTPRELSLAELIERGEPPFPEKPLSQNLRVVFDLYGLAAGAKEWTPLTDSSALASGDSYFIHAASLNGPSQLYVFTCDAAGKVQWLFPKNDTSPLSTGTNDIAPGQGVSLPDGQRAYRLDDTIGEERFYAIFSATKWPELERALQRACRDRTFVHLPLPAPQAEGFHSRGIASITTTDAAPPDARADSASATAVSSARPAFRSSQHWVLLTRVLRHVAPGPADTTKAAPAPVNGLTLR